MKKIFFILIVSVIFISEGKAQYFSFVQASLFDATSVSVRDSTVLMVANEDSIGLLDINTGQTEFYNHSEMGIGSSFMINNCTMGRDSRGYILCDSNNHFIIVKIDNGSFSIHNIPNSYSWITRMIEDDNRVLWFGAGEDLIEDSNGIFNIHHCSISNSAFSQITMDGSKVIWLTNGNDEIFKYENGTFTNVLQITSSIYDIQADSAGILWFRNYQKLFRYKNGVIDTFDASNSPLISQISSMAVKPNGTVAVPNSFGIEEFNGTSWSDYSYAPGAGQGPVSDNLNNIWMWTYDHSPAYIYRHNLTWDSYEFFQDFLNQPTTSVLTLDESSNAFVGTKNGLAFVNSENTQNRFRLYDSLNSPLADNEITCLGHKLMSNYFGAQKWTAVGTNNGLYILDTLGPLWIHYDTSNFALPNDSVICIFQQNLPLPLWVGTKEGLAVLNADSTWSEFDISNCTLPSNQINCIYEFGSQIWIGTDKGIAIYNDQGVWSTPDSINSLLPDSDVTAFYSDYSDTYYWIGTRSKGVLRIDHYSGAWNLLNTSSGLASDSITLIVYGGVLGDVYVGSKDQGLMYFNVGNYSGNLMQDDGRSFKHIYDVSYSQFVESSQVWVATDAGVMVASFGGGIEETQTNTFYINGNFDHNNLHLNFTIDQPSDCRVQLFDLLGRNFYSGELSNDGTTSKSLVIPTYNLSGGIYLATVSTDKEQSSVKVFKDQ